MSFIINNPIAAILLDMGMGKTSIVLTAIMKLMYDRFEVNRVLIIGPLRVARTTWPEEIKKWDHLDGLRYSVVVGTVAERKAALRKNADVIGLGRLRRRRAWFMSLDQRIF